METAKANKMIMIKGKNNKIRREKQKWLLLSCTVTMSVINKKVNEKK